ncbi:MAG: type II secretion system GspH family protein [Candidatus Moranbacteria bacterium]|nr:type II secretion system GspH family protein [Candidatus Moranbacteria bacterium]
MNRFSKQKGFTLIELLIVIAIVGILSSVVLVALGNARLKAQDAKRISEIRSIETALEEYYTSNGQYPASDMDGTGGWDVGNQTLTFLSNLGVDVPEDPVKTGSSAGYVYYRYNPGSGGCDSNKGSFYVLGITDLESSSRPSPDSPGFSCPLRDWQTSMDWVTGRFEN